MRAETRLFVADTTRARSAALIAGGLLALAVLAAVAWWTVAQRQDARGPATRLKDLPALPEEIEARGKQAESLLPPDDARKRNAVVPFVGGPLRTARPFLFTGSAEDRARALQCLATAVLYEAGDDTVGQAAVAQVVLNRVRHAAFPATICGVVYQGAQRTTGCQFTFTCDGSLRRRMSEGAWRRARDVAERALSGHVDDSVGLATHYHTDWVYPYWSAELNKLARVGTHLFFGWPGAWGGPSAFGRTYRGNETMAGTAVAGMPAMEDAPAPIEPGPPKILGLPQAPAKLPEGMSNVPLYGNRLRLARSDGRAFGLLAPSDAAAAKLVNAALALCAKPGPCQVNAWSNEDDIPGEYPIPAGSRSTMVFEYVRDGAAGKGSVRFDCERFPNRDPKLCLASRPQPAELSGIRWKE